MKRNLLTFYFILIFVCGFSQSNIIMNFSNTLFDNIKFENASKNRNKLNERIEIFENINNSQIHFLGFNKLNTDFKKTFWRFLLVILLISFVYLKFFQSYLFLVDIYIAPVELFQSRILTLICQIFAFFVGIILVFQFQALIAHTVKFFINSPGVSHSWIYYLTGVVCSVAPFNAIYSKLTERNFTYQESNKKYFYTPNLLMIPYLLFCFFPSLLNFKFFQFFIEILYLN